MTTAIAVRATRIEHNLDSHNSKNELFAKWIYNCTMGTNKRITGRILTKGECGSKIAALMNHDEGANLVTIQAWVSLARKYFHRHLGCTIHKVYMRGWRASTDIEYAQYYGKRVSKTLAACEEIAVIGTGVKTSLLDYAIREVTKQAGGKIEALSPMRKKYIDQWKLVQQKQAEIEDKTK